MITRLAAVALAVLVLVAPARADEETELRRMLGVLVYTRVDVDLDDAPVRDAFALLQAKLGIPIIGRYADDAVGYGIDPAVRISMTGSDLTALDALEALLAQCTHAGTECAWQFRRGFLEVGTKGRLGVPAARVRRLYDVRDLMIEAPDLVAGAGNDRRLPQELALDVVRDVVETIEPGTWDWGQIEYGEDEAEGERLARAPGEPAAEPDPALRTRRHVSRATMSIIRQWRDVLIVDAPDFVHRQLNGYPPPIRPGAAPEAEVSRWRTAKPWRYDPSEQ